ncbi:MAG: arsinothricin resistance N-acetyltransferase ArsN1 family B [Anaerolineales bacterium]
MRGAELLRIARMDDAEQLLEIYRPVVLETAISFEVESPSVAEMQERIAHTLERLPWLIIEDEGRVVAYAYATPHRERLAYQWSADVSVYVHPKARRRGLARRLYTSLLDILRFLGYYNAYAGIALPNEGSLRLHETMGFTQIAVYHKVGYKQGLWRDVSWWGLVLQPHSPSPAAPLLFSEMVKDGEIKKQFGI